MRYFYICKVCVCNGIYAKFKFRHFIVLSFLLTFIACGNKKNAASHSTAVKQKIDWNSAADSSTNGLIRNYWNPEEHYFNTNNQGNTRFQYWPQAHALDVLVQAYLRTGNQKYVQYI